MQLASSNMLGDRHEPLSNTVKLDIVTGFLGSGKTTLIQTLLHSLKDEKVVIIENEYGQIQIDKELLRVRGFDVYELTNGCVCCTLKEDFRLTLYQILEQKPDRIIFEPSGIFVLSEIFELLRDVQISTRCKLNSVITVVDALNYYKYANNAAKFFTNQIVFATSLVISKTQFIPEEDVEKITAELRTINEWAPIFDVNWEELTMEQIATLLNSREKRDRGKGVPHEDYRHVAHDYKTLGFHTDKVFTIEELKHRLYEVSNGKYGEVIRCKGIVRSPEGNLEFNYVYGDFDIKPFPLQARRAVSFVGTRLEEQTIKKAFGQ